MSPAGKLKLAAVVAGVVLASSPAARVAALDGLDSAGLHLPPVAASSATSGGYANGRIPARELCTIGQGAHRLQCGAAASFRQLSAAYADTFGAPLRVTDSYRTYAAQVSCRARKGPLCAVPGTSNHGLGLAVDLAPPAHVCGSAAHRWLERNAGRYGWLWPAWARPGTGTHGAAGECWHWQYRTTT